MRIPGKLVVLPLFALLTVHSYAATPERAAIQAVDFRLKKRPNVLRVNIVGSYAAVLMSGGMMEGAPVTAPILVQRFSFGWQTMDLLNFRCSLSLHALGSQTEERLMRGMPRPRDDRPCRGLRDAGPQRDIETIRKLMRGPLVPDVVVSGDWAMGDWYGAGGGESLYQRRYGRWRLVAYGGGAMGVLEMRAYKVPRSDWCRFGIYDVRCH